MRYFLVILLLMLLPGFNQAQPSFIDGHMQERPIQRRGPNKDRIMMPKRNPNKIGADKLLRAKMVKAAYITRQLDLTPAQNEKFWPLYNKFQDELFAAQAERRRNNLNPSPDNKEKFAIEYKIIDIKARYNAEFLKIMPPDRVNLIYKSEQQFNDELIKQRMEKKEEAN